MLQLVGATKIYKSSGFGIKGIDLVLPDKGMVIVKGESGSGKSTLMNILTGSDYLDSGKYLFNDTEITAKNADDYRRNHISTIYQDFRIIEDLSVSDNVALAMQACNNKVDREYIRNIISKVGLEKYVDTLPKNLSGGELQRCAIARAIAKQDTAICADEPTGNLDSANGKQIMDLLKEISQERLVVVITHNESYAKQYADMTVTLRDGTVASVDGEQMQDEESTKEQAINKSKPKLSAKTMLKLTKWSFGKKKVKMSIIIVFTVLVVMMSFFATYLALGNYNQSLVASFRNNSNQQYFADDKLDKDSLDAVNQRIEKYTQLLPIYSVTTNRLAVVSDEYLAQKGDYVEIFDSVIQAESMEQVDTHIIAGEFPKDNTEILLPSSYAKSLVGKEYLVIDNQDSTIITINKIEDLIGCSVQWFDGDLGEQPVTTCYGFVVSGVFEDYYTPDSSNVEKETYAKQNSLKRYAIVGANAGEIFANTKIKVDYTQKFLSFKYYLDSVAIPSVSIFDSRMNIGQIEELGYNEVYLPAKMASKFEIGQTVDLVQKTIGGLTNTSSTVIQQLEVKGFYDGIDIGIIVNEMTFDNCFDVGHSVTSQTTFNGRLYEMNYTKLNKMLDIMLDSGYINNDKPSGQVEEKIYFYGTNTVELMNECDVLSSEFLAIRIIIFIITIAILVLLLLNNVGVLMESNKRGIVVLRTIGFDFGSILQVVFMQFSIVAVIESVLGICLYAIARFFVNMIFNHNIANFVLFIFTWYQFAIIIGAIFLINLIVGTWKTHKIFDGAVSTKYGE